MIPGPLLALAILNGCTGDDTGRVPSTSTSQPLTVGTAPPPIIELPTPPPQDTSDTATVESGSTGDTAAPVDPCLNLPSAPLSSTLLTGYPSTEEFHFDASGDVWNASDSDSAVFRTPLGGPIDFFTVYDTVETAGTRVFPDGSALAICNEWEGTIDRVDLTTGARNVILSGIDQPNSIGFDNRDNLYIAAYGSILRYPLAGGAVETLVSVPWHDFDGITFAPDFSRLYFNYDEGGTVLYLDLAPDGTVLANGVLAQITQFGWPAELDGATVDMCGNVYVIGTGGDLYRIDPVTGDTLRYYTVPGYSWTTSVNFGSGAGGWGRDRIYIMERYDGLIELEVGVEGYPEPHY